MFTSSLAVRGATVVYAAQRARRLRLSAAQRGSGVPKRVVRQCA